MIALSLFDDGDAATGHRVFSSEEAPIVDLGTWVDNGDDTITVTFTGRRRSRASTRPIVVTFQRDGDFLQSIGSEELYGSEGLRLRLAADVARDVGASLITMDLAAGFPLDPTFVSVQAGGEVDASLLASHCVGFINQQPVVTVNWTGATPYVEVFFVSDSDPTLVVLTPDGQLLCNDDAHEDLLDPAIEPQRPGDRHVPDLGGQLCQEPVDPRRAGAHHQARGQPWHLQPGRPDPAPVGARGP